MTVDDYLEALPPARRERVTALRALIHQAVPDVSERIEWRMPVFGRGDRWVGVASQKSYISVYLGCEDAAAGVLATDPGLKGGKACVNIPDRVDVPLAALLPAIRKRLSA
ncbi:iron chaperone [Polymorphobacter fuscus]|uniref:DUF1801 domain-containing protein n=1 Tax=Sandarakinorhabdus fusca TaxID=1439888 RepID=A0A7C9LG19_9SPHN|nr:DUF1801 domain-containing protein [Polymorphobacter fuscus]KAB7647824.1 DUF1801 domain-containing protein [Polymorphobacter fuscus]MQT17127.1 DUF1801 domain-containing protein [Polymorphobacter fuscus]NJC08881.1 uncharacterized protein YdhG (YjbR/CyaY superfamily) [Polymorphobacter fuscus]